MYQIALLSSDRFSNVDITISTNRIIYEFLVLANLLSVKSGQRDQWRHSKLATPFILKVCLPLKMANIVTLSENTYKLELSSLKF